MCSRMYKRTSTVQSRAVSKRLSILPVQNIEGGSCLSKFDEPAVLTLYVGHPACTDFTGAGIAKLILSYLVKNVGLTKELILK